VLSQADVREAFHYDPDTGDLIWRVRSREHYKTAAAWKRCNTRFAGKPFGRIGRATRSVSYRQGLFMGKRRMAHRLIFLYIYGYLPEQIDHIDGDGLNNRIENLRDATRSENARNRVCPINNAAGALGVEWIGRCNKWKARIFVSGKLRHLGYFDTKQEAIDARKHADQRYGFHKNHGRILTQ